MNIRNLKVNDLNLSSKETSSERAWLCSDLMESVFALGHLHQILESVCLFILTLLLKMNSNFRISQPPFSYLKKTRRNISNCNYMASSSCGCLILTNKNPKKIKKRYLIPVRPLSSAKEKEAMFTFDKRNAN